MRWNTLNHTHLIKRKLGEWLNEAMHLSYGSIVNNNRLNNID